MKVAKKKRGFFARAAMRKKINAHHKNKKTIDPAALNQMIKEKAYSIWEEIGRPQGQDVDIWVRAEKEVYAEVKK